MGREGISYEQVAAAADQLIAAGQRPTLRAVRAELGTGSMSTINSLLTRYLETRSQPAGPEATLSGTVQRALLDEINGRVAEARADLTQRLADAEGAASELTRENTTLLEETKSQADRIEQLQQLLSAEYGRVGQLTSDLLDTQTAQQRERDNAESARQALARAELRLEAIPDLQKELAARREARDAEFNARIQAEREAAGLRERLEAAEQRAQERGEQLERTEKALERERSARQASDKELARSEREAAQAQAHAEERAQVIKRLEETIQALRTERRANGKQANEQPDGL